MTRKIEPESAEEVQFFVRNFAMCGEASTWMLENAHCGLRQLWKHCERADWLAYVARGLFDPRFVMLLSDGLLVYPFGTVHPHNDPFRLADRETTTRAHAEACAQIRARYTYADVRRRARQRGYLP